MQLLNFCIAFRHDRRLIPGTNRAKLTIAEDLPVKSIMRSPCEQAEYRNSACSRCLIIRVSFDFNVQTAKVDIAAILTLKMNKRGTRLGYISLALRVVVLLKTNHSASNEFSREDSLDSKVIYQQQ
jgi:hypothetical protein